VGAPILPGDSASKKQSDGLDKKKTDNSRSRKWFFVLLIVFVVGLAISASLSVMTEYIPTHQKVIYRNFTDLDVILTLENDIQVPVQNYAFHKITFLKTEIYFKTPPIYIKDIKLSSNSTTNSTSIITVKDANVTQIAAKTGVWVAPIEIGHSLTVKNYSEPYYVDIYYVKGNDTRKLLRETIPFTWAVTTLDFGKPSYFWIVFSGVLLSRVFTFTRDSSDKVDASIHFTSLELLWVPFSAFITLLIFSSFRDQFHPSLDIITNLALAFGVGFGFDKIFEVWAKAPK
jgi:hypothetical protein